MDGLLFFILIIGIIFKLISLYFGGIACFSIKKEAAYPPAKTMRRFAVLTAARNEGAVIGNFVDSVQVQDYPQELFDIFVIPNNCTDDTEEVARLHGAQIIHCHFPVKCKGDALQQAMLQLEHKGYDAFCVFDSDNVLKSDFLLRTNEVFDAGAKVVKGRQLASNPQASWVAGCYSMYFNLFHIFFNKARGACGLSAKLVGTGFAVHKDVLRRLGGWNTTTIAEDAEFSAQCAMLGERIWWAPDAITYDEQPTSFRLSLIQRRRWCSGIMQVGRLHLVHLLQSMRRENFAYAFDFIMFLLAAFAQGLSFLTPLLMLVASLLAGGDAPQQLLLTSGGLLACYYVVMCCLGAFVATEKRGQAIPLALYPAILLFPVFMASWFPLQVLSLFSETTHWNEIRHTGSRKIPSRTSN